MFGVFYELAFVGRRAAKSLGDDVHRVYMRCGVLTLFIWMLYPVAWGLCEGGNLITPNDEAVFYGCLDLIAKPVFSIMMIHGHWGIAPERLGLRISDTDEMIQSREKRNDSSPSPNATMQEPVA
jgi:bacteriorhodopsin